MNIPPSRPYCELMRSLIIMQRAKRAHATRPVTFFPCPSLDTPLRWRPHKWSAKGIDSEDPARCIAFMRRSRLTPAEAAAKAKEAQDMARYSSKYRDFRPQDLNHRIIVMNWEGAGPPPISEYKLTFGKHRGKRLEEVPDTYLVKYLIPQSRETGTLKHECPLAGEAIRDFQERHPDVKSQAGREKTKPLANREAANEKPKRRVRRKAPGKDGRSKSLAKYA